MTDQQRREYCINPKYRPGTWKDYCAKIELQDRVIDAVCEVLGENVESLQSGKFCEEFLRTELESRLL